MRLIDFCILLLAAVLWAYAPIAHPLLTILTLVALVVGRVLVGERLR